MEVEILKQCLLKIKKALSCLYILFSPNSNRTPDFYSPPPINLTKIFMSLGLARDKTLPVVLSNPKARTHLFGNF